MKVRETRSFTCTWLASVCAASLLAIGMASGARAQLSEGPNDPGAVANNVTFGTVAWTSPMNADASDDADASVSPGTFNSQYLEANNFGFNIPSPALIKGIEVSIERHCLAGVIKDTQVRIEKGGVVGATERGDLVTAWPTVTDAVKTYGGSGDLWGETWTASDINSNTFGVALSVNGNGDAAFVDHISVKVYYDLCQPAPQIGCRTATKSLLLVKDSTDDTKDKFLFKWIKGQATSQTEFANPTATATYATCVYENGALSFSLIVPPDGTAWSQIGTKGYKYKDLTGSQSGVQKIIVKGSTDMKSKILVKGRGVVLPDPVPPLSLPVKVQVINSDSGLCWDATFSTFKKNQTGLFKAKN